MTKQLTQAQVDGLERRHPEERRRIREAAAALLQDGEDKPTIEDLRIGAGLPERWVLTTRHIDLKDDFLRAVRERWGREARSQSALQRRYDDLLQRHTRLQERAVELEALVDTYAVVIEELSLGASETSAATVRRIR